MEFTVVVISSITMHYSQQWTALLCVNVWAVAPPQALDCRQVEEREARPGAGRVCGYVMDVSICSSTQSSDWSSSLSLCFFFWTEEWHEMCWQSQVAGSLPGCKNPLSGVTGPAGISYSLSCGWRFSQLECPAAWSTQQYFLFSLCFWVCYHWPSGPWCGHRCEGLILARLSSFGKYQCFI